MAHRSNSIAFDTPAPKLRDTPRSWEPPTAIGRRRAESTAELTARSAETAAQLQGRAARPPVQPGRGGRPRFGRPGLVGRGPVLPLGSGVAVSRWVWILGSEKWRGGGGRPGCGRPDSRKGGRWCRFWGAGWPYQSGFDCQDSAGKPTVTVPTPKLSPSSDMVSLTATVPAAWSSWPRRAFHREARRLDRPRRPQDVGENPRRPSNGRRTPCRRRWHEILRRSQIPADRNEEIHL